MTRGHRAKKLPNPIAARGRVNDTSGGYALAAPAVFPAFGSEAQARRGEAGRGPFDECPIDRGACCDATPHKRDHSRRLIAFARQVQHAPTEADRKRDDDILKDGDAVTESIYQELLKKTPSPTLPRKYRGRGKSITACCVMDPRVAKKHL